MKSSKIILYVVNVDWFFKSHRLALALEAIKRNYKVVIITENTGLFHEFNQLGFECHNISFGRGFNNPLKELISAFRLIHLYKRINPDIVHQITMKPYLYGSFASKFTNSNFLIINAITGLGYLFTNKKKSFLGNILKRLLSFALSSKKRIKYIFQNEDDLVFFKKIIHLDDSDFSIIKGAGVDENEFFKTNRAIPKNKLRVTLVARMLKDKGVIEFIKAAKLSRDELFDKCEFILVGGLDYENPARILDKELLELVEDEYISWLGHREDIKEIYNNTDIACLPSYREGLPKSLIEAMAMECPIITTDAPGCRDCVDDGINGYLVPVGDYKVLSQRILTLVNNEDLRKRMGQASREKMIREMSLNKVLDKTFSIYED